MASRRLERHRPRTDCWRAQPCLEPRILPVPAPLAPGRRRPVHRQPLARAQQRLECGSRAYGSHRSTLALAEPADPGAAQGQALVNASDSAYYRIKAAYVFWMLRGLAGDTALSAALRAYVPAEDTRPEYFEELLERASGKNLRWFFDSWVYQDRGLPDLAVTNVFPTRGSGSAQYLVAVDVANDGYADVEVPVTVRSLTSSVTETVRILGRSKATHRFSIEGAPTEVLVNDGTVPEVQASIHQQTLRAAAP